MSKLGIVPSPASRDPGPSELLRAARVARLYYLENQSKVEIADQLQLNRFRVARLLDLAHRRGMVHITICEPGTIDSELSERVQDRLRLRRAVVVNTVDGDPAIMRDQLGATAASLLEDIVTAEDVLGIGWSRSVLSMAGHVDRLPSCEIVQLTGALTRPDVPQSTVQVVQDLARLCGGVGYSFYAPLFVSDPPAAEALLRQPDTAATFAQFSRVTKAVVGVGGWMPPDSTLFDAISPMERVALLRNHVQADLSGIFLDREGRALRMPSNTCVVGIEADQLRAVPEVVALAYGAAKVGATRIAIRAGLIDTLVTDSRFAQRLLAG